MITGGTRLRSWLRHCATSRKVAVSIPDGVIGIFHWHIPSIRIMALGLTQPLTEMSTRNISWGKGGRCVGLTTLPPSCADCLDIWEPQPPGIQSCNGIALSFYMIKFLPGPIYSWQQFMFRVCMYRLQRGYTRPDYTTFRRIPTLLEAYTPHARYPVPSNLFLHTPGGGLSELPTKWGKLYIYIYIYIYTFGA
jgi:hypothetical protein